VRPTLSFTLVTCSLILFAATAIPSVNAAPPSDACALLTEAQVNGVLGLPVGAGQHLTPNSPSACVWGREDPGSKKVTVSIYTQNGSRTPVDRFNTAKMPVQGIAKTPVSGVGDDAVYVTSLGTVLIFRKGDSVFDVRISGFPLDQIKEKEKTLALGIIAKL
jgi:hypothetical protein